MRRARQIGHALAGLLERAGVIEREHLAATVELAWPRTVTGFAIMSKQAVDLALVGLTVGPAAVAGLAFANAYWLVGKRIGIGLTGGAVGLVSQNYGGGADERASLVVKQSVWVALAFALPVALAYGLFARPLIDLVGSDPAAVGHGATYLTFVAPGLLFEFLNLIASRTYAGVGDTRTPMVVRAGGAVLNILISGVLIFGLGMGVTGAAIGTTVSTGATLLLITWGMFGRSYGTRLLQPSPVALRLGGPQVDLSLARQLLTVSTPLMVRRVTEGLVIFPLLAIAATFGPLVVAGLEVGRRVRQLATSFSWGFSIAASTLVGQRLGQGDESGAEAYGGAILRLSTAVYAAVSLVVLLFAAPIAGLFVNDPGTITEATTFVRVGALSAVALGIDGSATGALRGAGDTRWPLVASLLGRYAVGLPLAALGTVTALGVTGLYLALVAETVVPAAITTWRFRTNRWKVVSRAYRPSSEPG